jgi:hypothetical protein
MLKKSHVLVLGVATAGLIGLGAPMAGAATVSGPSSLVNVSNNQIPLQLCGNDVYGNVIGGQVPVAGDALVASLLSPGSYTVAKGVNNRGCVELNNQQNKHNWADGTGQNGTGAPKHGKCPCHAEHAANDGSVTSTSNLPGKPVNGDAVNTNVAGTPVNGGAITSGLSGSPVSGVVNSALQGSK